MTSAKSTQRLSATEVHAIRRAAQFQLKRWAKAGLDAESQQRGAELRRVLRALRMFRDGCELHPISDREGVGTSRQAD
jgi:hypothetical protein